MTDRGMDALVHRLTDGAYCPIQAKGRSVLETGQVHLVVWADSLADDDALLVSGEIVEGGLGPTTLVISEGEFKKLAHLSHHEGRRIYSMEFGEHPRERSRWFSFLVPTERLAERFGVSPAAVAAEAPAPTPAWRSDLGFLGEIETARLLAEASDLNLFRPFPDLEESELVVLHLTSRKVLGLQVKTIGVDQAHPAGTVTIHASTLRPSATTCFVVLGWLREANRFHEECLLIPSDEVRAVCEPDDSHGHLKFDWHPGSLAHTHLDAFRVSIDGLRATVESRLA
jgi:hypothetical protein